MGDRSMEACLTEQLEFIREAIRVYAAPCGATVQDWYDDGASFEIFSDDMDPTSRESVAYAWGYLSGAADCLDLTVMEMLDHFGLSFDDPKTIRHAWSGKKKPKGKVRHAK